MEKYMTKQRKLLIEYFASHADEALSARQIANGMGEAISISAVYRNLAALEAEGLVKRVSKTGNREVYYRYIDAPECRECLHFSCKCCGRTYHMNKTSVEKLMRIAEENGFSIDKSDTVLYGICADCKGI